MTEDQMKGVVACLTLGGVLMVRSIRSRKVTQKIADTPRSKVATAPQGYVELEGFAWPAAAVGRSVAADELVYYSLQLQRSESRGSGKNRRQEWVTVFTHGHIHPFYLVDATGLALVDPAAAELDLESPRIRKWGALSAPERDQIITLTRGVSLSGFPPGGGLFGIFSNSYRVVEKEIRIGSPLYLHGDFRTLSMQIPPAKVPGLSEFASRVFNLQARSTKNLSHFLDKNRDGKISSDESRHGYVFAARQARMKAKGEISAEKEFEVYGNVGSSTAHRLLIADTHEGHLVERRGRYLWLQFVGGAILIALGVANLFPGAAVNIADFFRRSSPSTRPPITAVPGQN